MLNAQVDKVLCDFCLPEIRIVIINFPHTVQNVQNERQKDYQ